MSKKPPTSARTTIYHIRGISQLRKAVRTDYLESSDFTDTETKVNGREALLVSRTMHCDPPEWASRLSNLSEVSVNVVGNVTAAAVLLVKDTEGEVWALTYGIGFRLIEPEVVDSGFGMRVAIRTATRLRNRSEASCLTEN